MRVIQGNHIFVSLSLHRNGSRLFCRRSISNSIAQVSWVQYSPSCSSECQPYVAIQSRLRLLWARLVYVMWLRIDRIRVCMTRTVVLCSITCIIITPSFRFPRNFPTAKQFSFACSATLRQHQRKPHNYYTYFVLYNMCAKQIERKEIWKERNWNGRYVSV